MDMNNIINEIGGVTMKTIEDIKPVIDKAVEKASEIKEAIATSKEDIIKSGPEMESTISVQDIPESKTERTSIQPNIEIENEQTNDYEYDAPEDNGPEF